MYTCASCQIHACEKGDRQNLPKNCPMRKDGYPDEIAREYDREEDSRFYIESTKIESRGYGQWTRMREVVEFAKSMGYSKLGVAFCAGLKQEGKLACDVLRKHGFEVVSVICKNGGISKERVGIGEDEKVHPGQYEPMCNPIGQARLMNEQHTQFNIVIGLCVGHDSLFYKYSEAPVTTLVTKDRVLAHNPVGALYCSGSYYRNKL